MTLVAVGFLPVKDELFSDNGNVANLMQSVLKIPWNYFPMAADPCLPWKTKSFCLQILPMLGSLSQSVSDLDVLDLGLQDEAEEVRSEAIIAMPLIGMCRFGTLTPIFKRLG